VVNNAGGDGSTRPGGGLSRGARMRSLIILLGLFAAVQAAAQQVGSIRGVVYDADFDRPAPDVRVTIVETGRTVTTGEQGNYVFPEVEPGTYTLVFNAEGFTRQVEGNVVVNPGRLTEVDASLTGEFTEMAEFVVQDLQLEAGTEAQLLDLRMESPALLDSIGEDFLSRAGAGDAAEGLRLVAGATTTNEGFAAVRGLPPRFVSTQLNGFVLPSANPDTRAFRLDLLQSDVIESIQVSKTFTPDQQGTASGGAVNIVTKSIPAENFIKISSGVEYNTERADDGEFLVDARGDVPFFGIDEGRRLSDELKGLVPGGATLGRTAFGSPAPQFGDAPVQYDWDITGGLRYEFDTGFRIGGQFAYFWEQDSGHDDDRINDERVARTGSFNQGLIPDVSNDDPNGFLQSPLNAGTVNILTNLFDETQSTHEVTWGGLGTVGLESDNHAVKFTFLHTRLTSSTTTIAEDTRGKLTRFPNHDPDSVVTPGGAEDPNFGGSDTRDFAPFRRLEIQEYVERTVQSAQFSGDHTLPWFEETIGIDGTFELLAPRFDWHATLSSSERREPGTTIFDSKFLSAANIASFVSGEQTNVEFDVADLSFFNTVFRDIEEDSTQLRFNGEFPFRQWSDDEGSLKLGVFDERTTRDFRQDTFAIQGESGLRLFATFDEARLSEAFVNPGQFPLDTGSPPELSGFTFADLGEMEPTPIDFTYEGRQDVEAWYWMLDLPLSSFLRVIGGFRFENTSLGTDIESDFPATTVFVDQKEGERIFGPGFIPGSVSLSALAGQGVTLDTEIEQEDVLPSLSVVVTPIEGLGIRGAYSETIARPTFRELTPVSQSLFAGETPFVGNPFLTLSVVENWDLRLDYRPQPGSLLSLSYFRKYVENPIQVVQQGQGASNIVIPINFPEGTIEGWELEARQELGEWFEPLRGLQIGGNLTLLDTEVTLRDFESSRLAALDAPLDTIPMTNAPEHLYNLFMTYDYEPTGTQISIFYTVRGDTLIASPGVEGFTGATDPDTGAPLANFFIPGVYETEFGTLNLTIKQKIGEHIMLSFSAENLLDPEIETVYRSKFIPGGDVVKTRSSSGIDLSFGISANFTF